MFKSAASGFKSMDSFAESAKIRISQEKEKLTSFGGAICTIALAIIVGLFTWTKVLTLIEKQDVDIMSALIEGEVSFEEKFSKKDGFFIAVALTIYDDNEEITEQKEYGELIVEHYGWGYDEDTIGTGGGLLDYDWCTEEELGLLQGPNTRAYPILESSRKELQNYRKKFKCIKEDDMVIWGSYNSQKA